MGTTYSVKLVLTAEPSGNELEVWHDAIRARLDEVNDLMSTYLDTSEISRFNQASPKTAVDLSAPTAEVLRVAEEISAESKGAFDVTVGPAVDAWGFGPEVFTSPPDEATLESLRARIGYRRVSLHGASATKDTAGVELNLSAIAKGYAVDRVAGALDELGHANYLVEVGGEVKVRGKNFDRAPWRVAIERPEARQGSIHRVLPLEQGCLATSGEYRNSYEWEGRRYSHTIDPRTAAPVDHLLASASVHHESCARADAYATALMVLGPDEGVRFAQEADLAALLLVYNSDTVTESMTDAFAQLLETRSAQAGP